LDFLNRESGLIRRHSPPLPMEKRGESDNRKRAPEILPRLFLFVFY